MVRAVAISPGPFLTPAADHDLGDNQTARDAITRKTFSSALVDPRRSQSSRPSSPLTGRHLHHRRQLPGRRRRDRLVGGTAPP